MSHANAAPVEAPIEDIQQGHAFRAELPLSALEVDQESQATGWQGRADDIRTFFLSFAAFFLGISAFIW
ncbi:hypothetical protein [Alterisphingorhabdus coralli]|uniref:Uncharacterized protein n=1 Tax=Alterisphingorhabdus coralli TaxID=3071408 RepID=A0AA97F747_9SPHN|nr:hypothetical protein [Parasphingorhabdus sp. SCSIO 66989]WOE74482.1 hypothetical protein RB602_11570 [Parasphingorhabdus sp. SCSIO 66989]